MVICLEQGADMHMAQLMPLPLTISCFSKIQIGFTFLVAAHPHCPGQRAVKRVCVCVCVCARARVRDDLMMSKQTQPPTLSGIGIMYHPRAMALGWKSNCRSDIQMVMCYRLCLMCM